MSEHNGRTQNFRTIQDNWPVFVSAHVLGQINGEPSTLVYSIGHVRDPAIQYRGGTEASSVYFGVKSRPRLVDMAAKIFFLGNFDNAFDSKVNTDASGVSANYASIVVLSMRQALVTISKNVDVISNIHL